MSDQKAKELFARMASETKTELGRLAGHGASELAAALFSGHTFLPYGPGQRRDYEVSHELQQQQRESPEPEHEIER